MKLNIPVYKWNFLLFLKSKSPYPPTPQVAYLIDAIWQPKLNGVRGGWSVELRLEKVATSAHMHIQWDWEKNNRAQIVGWKPYPATFVLDTLWMACRISFETKPFSSIFFQGLDLKKEKKHQLLATASPFFNSCSLVVKKKATFLRANGSYLSTKIINVANNLQLFLSFVISLLLLLKFFHFSPFLATFIFSPVSYVIQLFIDVF